MSVLKSKDSCAVLFLLAMSSTLTLANGWQENPGMYNPSGVPSLTFSQPRFADLDGDGDQDLILGNTNDKPVYLTNTGSAGSPNFSPAEDIFSGVNSLDAEMAVFSDIDNDGDLDMITGGYRGINLYQNYGTADSAVFSRVDDYFPAFSSIQNPVPDLADVDNDGDKDMVVGFSESGEVRLYLNSGNDTLAVFSENDAVLLGDIGLFAYPVFCDLDKDGDFDITCGKDGHGFIYFENTGTAQSYTYLANTSLFSGIGLNGYFNSPGIVDLNGDGLQDLVFGNASGPLQYYVNTGTTEVPVWSENTSLFGGVLDIGAASNPFFVDFDYDGDLDMVTGTQMGDIKYIKNIGTPMVPVWRAPTKFTALKDSVYSSVTMADVNGDSLIDAIVGDLSGNLYYHRQTSSGFVSSSSALTIASLGGWPSACLVDMDFDGDFDIVAGNEDGNLFYFENSGTPESPAWNEVTNYFGGLDAGSDVRPALADIDFDGDYDLVVGNISGDLKCYMNDNGDWPENLILFAGMEGEQNTTPAFADLDSDGDQDLTLGNYDGYFTYYENTNPVLKITPGEIQPESCLIDNYPNPFNPVTTIRYSFPKPGKVEVTIFDLNGRLIEQMVNQKQTAGTHSIKWNASDMPSGIYIYQIKTGNLMLTNKCLLVK